MTSFSGTVDMRDGFGAALLELAADNEDIVALTADLSDTVRLKQFADQYPTRFFQIGISESDMMGTAAGLALGGKIAFPGTFAVFAASLANQTVRLSIAYNEANVKIVASHGGVTVGGDGATHQAFEDLALMRVLPNMTVIAPADANEAYLATKAAAQAEGPVYLRLARSGHPVLTDPAAEFEIGRASIIRDGDDVAIISTGAMLSRAIDAAELLSADGIEARVINLHTVKPIDIEAIADAARVCGGIVTVEEHSVLGGLGSAVCEVTAEHCPVQVERVGIRDTFGESGEPEEILAKYGLTAQDILSAARTVTKRKPMASGSRLA